MVRALLLAVLALAQQALVHAATTNECHPSKGCNVCAACCNEFIPAGAVCDACATVQCNATATTNECHPSKGCNVCTVCCNEFIPGGATCDACAAKQCAAPAPAPTPEGHDARYYLRYLALVLVPFVLRSLQAAVENRVGGCVKKLCCGSKSPLLEAWAPSDASNIGNGDTGLYQIGEGDLDGWAGWRELRDKLGWNHCLAVCVSLLRLFLWHLMQPAVYASVLFYYEPQIDRVQFHLGVAVLAREASYVLLILYALCTRPAFLLVNLDSDSESGGRLRDKIMYVLSPEKFLSGAALGEPGYFLMLLLLPLDCCALGALGVGLHNGDLPAPLAASYAATALAFFGFGAAMVMEFFC